MATVNVDVKKALDSLRAESKVVETWRDGPNWYRVWSDGFIEQGGIAKITGKNSTISGAPNGTTVTLNKGFLNTNYIVTATVNASQVPKSKGWVQIFNASNSSFKGAVVHYENGYNWDRISDIFWYAAGY